MWRRRKRPTLTEAEGMLVLYMLDLNRGRRKYGSYPPFLRGFFAIRHMLRKKNPLTAFPSAVL